MTESRLDWPAKLYVYGTWGYALQRARERAALFERRLWVYRAVVDGKLEWVVGWDPPRRSNHAGPPDRRDPVGPNGTP